MAHALQGLLNPERINKEIARPRKWIHPPHPSAFFSKKDLDELPLGHQVAKYLISQGIYDILPPAYLHPDIKAQNGYAQAMERGEKYRHDWIVGAINALLNENMENGAWKSLFESGALRPVSKSYIIQYPYHHPYWFGRIAASCGGRKKQTCEDYKKAHLAELFKFRREHFRSSMIFGKGRCSDLEELSRLGKLLLEGTRKREISEEERLACIWLEEHPPRKTLLFGSESEKAKQLFFETVKFPLSLGFKEANRQIRNFGAARAIPWTRYITKTQWKEFVRGGSCMDLGWCNIVKEGDCAALVRKPFSELKKRAQCECAVMGSDGRLYLAAKENGGIAIYKSDELTYWQVYKHPSAWTEKDIDQFGMRDYYDYYGSLYELAKHAMPDAMMGVKEWEMRVSKPRFFMNRLIFGEPMSRKKQIRFEKWKASLEEGSAAELGGIKEGERKYLMDKRRNHYVAQLGPCGLEIHTDGRMKIIDAAKWLGRIYGKEPWDLDIPHYGFNGLSAPISSVGGVSMVARILDPAGKPLHWKSHWMSVEETDRKLRALYFDWDDWVAWRISMMHASPSV
ncbi:MAG: hypothetical protein WC717_05980 [Candidatus Micrarchaeia archaeon]|jgi:hypothetical protein